MAVLKCKMCGGTLEVQEGATVCECEYCGSKQTIPTVDDEGLQTLYGRANMLRMKSEFDKASELYERILQKKENEAEAYWGLILCKYGIEYVEDPNTYMRVPTCHRTSYEAVTADEDYKNALKYAELGQRVIYEDEAKKIDELQRGILAIAQKEDPYDVFICYKETDDTGKRTSDSVIANDIYHQLKQEGFKVFYAAITLEDKLGTEYEPYIFSALNTSKVMLAIGTKPEYFNAVWVKNEWSRFLKIMKKDRGRLLIPCYRDMDPYELPEEFAHLQAQDMSKIGFINDIVRGIKKIIVKETPNSTSPEIIAQQIAGSTTASAQIKRGNMALEDHDWDKADSFFEEALNLVPESAEAFIGKFLVKEKQPGFGSWLSMQKDKYSSANAERKKAFSEETAHIEKKVQEYEIPGYLEAEIIRKEYEFDFDYTSSLSSRKNQKESQLQQLASDRLLSRAIQYAKGDTKKQIEEGLAEITLVLDERIEQAKKDDETKIARKKEAYADHLLKVDKKVASLNKEAQKKREQEYEEAVSLYKNASDIPGYEKARVSLTGMKGYKDSSSLVEKCQGEIDRLTEIKLQEELREAEAKLKRKKRTIGLISAVIVTCVVVSIAVVKIIIPNKNYNAAIALMESEDYDSAIKEFNDLNGYKDSAELIIECETRKKEAEDNKNYTAAEELFKQQKYADAAKLFSGLNGFKDANERLNDCYESIIDNALIGEKGANTEALEVIPDEFYSNHQQQAYDYALSLTEQKKWTEAEKYFELCREYESSSKYISYINAMNAISDEDYDTAIQRLKEVNGFLDADDLLRNLCYEKIQKTEHMDIDEAIELLNESSVLSSEAQNLLDSCTDLKTCTGKYICYQKLKKDGTMTTNDINYSIELSFYLQYGVPYLDVYNSLFHDTALYDAPVETGTDGYTYIARCTSSKDGKTNSGTEDIWFSATEAKYTGFTFGNVYYYNKAE